jgi:hypothetical protein
MAKFGVIAVAAAVVGSALLTGTASATTDTWDNCPSGRACLFSDYSGHGAVWYPLGCGYVNLHNYGVGDWAKSYRTYGNRIRMHAFGEPISTEYQAWSMNNFDSSHIAVYDEMEVVC